MASIGDAYLRKSTLQEFAVFGASKGILFSLFTQLIDVEIDTIFEEKSSAKDTNRSGLKRCLKHLRNGDTLHIHSIDRLARDLRDLEILIEQLSRKGIEVKFHKENLTFTGDDSPMSVPRQP